MIINKNPGLLPCIVQDKDMSLRGLIADTQLAHGVYFTAHRFSQKVPFTLMYFFVFGKAPRALSASPASTFKVKA